MQRMSQQLLGEGVTSVVREVYQPLQMADCFTEVNVRE